jgi:hypothetical protein
MEREDRTRADDDAMIHTAHASRYHWGRVAAAPPLPQLARGEWQVSRVYTVLNRPEPALHHGQRVLDICLENGIGDWAKQDQNSAEVLTGLDRPKLQHY